MNLQNEEAMLRNPENLDYWPEQPGSQAVHKWETSHQRKAIWIMYSILTKIDKVKIFCVLHDKVGLLTRRFSERGIRNRLRRTFRKVLIYIYIYIYIYT